jgi:hypothetical protein
MAATVNHSYRAPVEKTLLKLVGPVHIVGGIALALLSLIPSFQVPLISAIFGPQAPLEPAIFLVGVFGPTIASWGVLFTAVVIHYFARPSPSSWWFLISSIAVWIPLDTLLCWYYGVYLGVWLNLAVTAVLLTLLIRVKSLAYNKASKPDTGKAGID